MENELLPCGIPEAAVRRVTALGFSRREAEFLALAALLSGYFLERHYNRFAGVGPGWPAAALHQKVVGRGLGKTIACGRVKVLHLCSRRLYGAVGAEHIRHRRDHRSDYLQRKLKIMDFALAHRGRRFLATEAEKTDFFARRLGLPLEVLPAWRYVSGDGRRTTTRRFVDKFPVFLEESAGADPRAHFAYVEPESGSLRDFATHVERYRDLFRALPGCTVHLVAADGSRLDAYRSVFRQTTYPTAAEDFGAGESAAGEMLRFFHCRRIWEERRYAEVTEAVQRDFLAGRRRFAGEAHDRLYRAWREGSDEPCPKALADSGAGADLVWHRVPGVDFFARELR